MTRRRLFAGAGAAGALAAVAAALPSRPVEQPTAQADKTQDAEREGYRLTAHVQRYYQTAKI
ncbi:MAG TPA: formate dehydrogenase [Burkholderiaceae bacterium]|nr:formate dehydrogenase [Burkholderiaceae bacterium]